MKQPIRIPGRWTGSARSSGRRRRGQSLAEFALILPIALTLLGAGIDFARLYNSWVNLESATRDAAEWVATCVNGTTVLARCGGTGTATTATVQAKRVVCTELGLAATCTDPAVTVPTYTQDPSAASGGSASNPMTTVTVQATTNFQTIFPYPLLTNNGLRTLTIARQFAILQGR